MENINPEKIQKELSPETVEKTMRKIIDIDAKGTAYSSIVGFSNRGFHDPSEESAGKKEKAEKYWKELIEKIQKILSNGLIGVPTQDTIERKGASKDIKEKYLESLKQHKISNQFVFSNIVGRSEQEEDKISLTKIGNSCWLSISDFNIAVIFDKDFFKEDEPKDKNLKRSFLHDKWKFNADDPDVIDTLEKAKKLKPYIKYGDEMLKNYGKNAKYDGKGKAFDENGMPHPYEEFGFVFFPRVPKRTFQGLVVKIPKDELYNQRIQEVADAVLESNLQIPIYDTDGNVLWPQKMSFEEVKKLAVKTKQESE